MFAAIRRWREQRVLRTAALPDALWREALEALPFLAIYTDDELARLRDKVVLFLHAKGIVGARGHEVTPLERAIIALQACVLVLNLDFASLRRLPERDRLSGRVHPGLGVGGRVRRGAPQRASARGRGDAGRSGRAVVAGRRGVGRLGGGRHEPRDPRVRAQARHAQRRRQRLPAAAARPAAAAQWKTPLRHAFDDFHARVERGDDTAIDPYAAESPAEFFAVLSEVFFADPTLLVQEYPAVYRNFACSTARTRRRAPSCCSTREPALSRARSARRVGGRARLRHRPAPGARRIAARGMRVHHVERDRLAGRLHDAHVLAPQLARVPHAARVRDHVDLVVHVHRVVRDAQVLLLHHQRRAAGAGCAW